MESAIVVLILVVAIGIVVALAVRLRRTPIVGEGELGPARHDATRLTPDRTSEPDATDPTPGERGPGIHVTKTVVTRRIVLRVEADRIAITVDGQPYETLDQVPEAMRADVRARLASMPAWVEDPAARLKVENSLRNLGIEPAPSEAPEAS